MSYDHNKKAGNRGDVVKHPALLAALWDVFSSWPKSQEFTFADTYAGYAHNPLAPGGEWGEGIDAIRGLLGAVLRQPGAQSWLNWYVATPRPSLCYGTYPGSSVMALDLAENLGIDLRVRAWDLADGPIASLKNTLGAKHAVHQASAEPSGVSDAHFLFIDPPSLEEWLRRGRSALASTVPNVLAWLPLTTNGKGFNGGAISARSDDARKDAVARGFGVSRVQWGSRSDASQSPIGCQLVYRFVGAMTAEALRAAVDEVCALWKPRWRARHWDGSAA